MTVTEMHDKFKMGVDKTDSLNAPNFEPAEIDHWLNVAQERFIKTRYRSDKGVGFEETQKRTDDLRKLIKAVTITPQPSSSLNEPNGRFFDILAAASDYWFTIKEAAEITHSCNGSEITERAKVFDAQHNDLETLMEDPFNKPMAGAENRVLRVMYQNYAELFSDGTFTINKYFLRYIMKPQKIDVSLPQDCQLADHTHQEIVDIAVAAALENIESKRYQTNLVELNKQE